MVLNWLLLCKFFPLCIVPEGMLDSPAMAIQYKSYYSVTVLLLRVQVTILFLLPRRDSLAYSLPLWANACLFLVIIYVFMCVSATKLGLRPSHPWILQVYPLHLLDSHSHSQVRTTPPPFPISWDSAVHLIYFIYMPSFLILKLYEGENYVKFILILLTVSLLWNKCFLYQTHFSLCFRIYCLTHWQCSLFCTVDEFQTEC
jgi:hypothetical protein